MALLGISPGVAHASAAATMAGSHDYSGIAHVSGWYWLISGIIVLAAIYGLVYHINRSNY